MICDLAETYHIYDYKAVPVHLLAVLVSGLRESSRVKTKLSGAKAPIDTILQAAAVDRLSMILWAQSRDGVKGRNRPASIVDMLNGQTEKASEVRKFNSGADFAAAWDKAVKGG